MGEFEEQARKYIETCANAQDRAYILALAVALDNSHARVESLVRASRDLGKSVEVFTRQAQGFAGLPPHLHPKTAGT